MVARRRNTGRLQQCPSLRLPGYRAWAYLRFARRRQDFNPTVLHPPGLPGMAEGMNIRHDFMPLGYIAIFSFPLHNKCVDVPSALITLTGQPSHRAGAWDAQPLTLEMSILGRCGARRLSCNSSSQLRLWLGRNSQSTRLPQLSCDCGC